MLTASDPELLVLGEPFAGKLTSMYANDPQLGLDGRQYFMDGGTKIVKAEGLWLYRMCLDLQVYRTLEIGLAYGFSTLYMLAAHQQKKTFTQHTAIDPMQDCVWWHSIGRAAAAAAGFGLGSDRFRFIDGQSAHVLPDLIAAGEQFDLIFIDGDHLFEAVLIDFYFSAKLLRPQGLLVFHDRWMQSVRTVKNFIQANRPDFEVMAHDAIPGADLVVARKISADTRDWHHFKSFFIAK